MHILLINLEIKALTILKRQSNLSKGSIRKYKKIRTIKTLLTHITSGHMKYPLSILTLLAYATTYISSITVIQFYSQVT